MRTLVVGAGAVGGYFGARLVQAGHEVTLSARGETCSALRRDGFTFITDAGTEHVAIPKAFPLKELVGAASTTSSSP
jgi:2-dehydropantoate 2-reductase